MRPYRRRSVARQAAQGDAGFRAKESKSNTPMWSSIQLSLGEAAVFIAAAGLLVLLLLGAVRASRRQKRELQMLKVERARADTQVREQARMIAKLRDDERTVGSLLRFLPGVVRQLDTARLDPRRVPNLIVQLAKALFEPEQVLFFAAKPPGYGGLERSTLHLQAHHGLRTVPQTASVIAFGAGKIGWVAETRLEMTPADWQNLVRTEGKPVADNHPSFHLDLIGPLVNRSNRGEEVLGVLCIGKPSARPRDPKLMLQMMTNLGSLALMNAQNMTELRDRANRDGLTGLTNKRAFLESLGILMTTAEREARKLAVFIFDIDHFKRYNDTNGHLAGDDLLKTMARVLRENVRPGDVVARYGGEEFIVAMPDTDAEAGIQHAEEIRKAIADYPFAYGENQPGGNLTISGGVAAFPFDGTNGTELIRHADQALYRSKASGRNRIARYRGASIGDPAGGFEDSGIRRGQTSGPR